MAARRSATETRRLLVDTGVAMLHERGVTAGVTHIRLQDVLRRAGLTTGAAYRLWSDQEAFHRELAVAATRWRDDAPLSATVRAIKPLIEGKAGLGEVIRIAAATHIDGFDPGRGATTALPARHTFLTTLALRATAGHDPDLQAASRERHADSVASFGELYAALMSVYCRRMRHPFVLDDFTAALAALGEGFALQAIEGEPHRMVEVVDGDGRRHRWTLFGQAIQALVDAFTEPIDACPGDAPDK